MAALKSMNSSNFKARLKSMDSNKSKVIPKINDLQQLQGMTQVSYIQQVMKLCNYTQPYWLESTVNYSCDKLWSKYKHKKILKMSTNIPTSQSWSWCATREGTIPSIGSCSFCSDHDQPMNTDSCLLSRHLDSTLEQSWRWSCREATETDKNG